MNRAMAVAIVAVVSVVGVAAGVMLPGNGPAVVGQPAAAPVQREGVPKLVDLGSTECVPCQLMAPILESMTEEFAGKLNVEFIDVGKRENAAFARQYEVQVIPTQVFLDADGKELWRHEGFISRYGVLDKFRELGYGFAAEALTPQFSRLEPAKTDDRPKESVCQFCGGNIGAKTRVTVATEKGDVHICDVHCYFIMYSCLLEDKTEFGRRVSVRDWGTEKPTPLTEATYVCGMEEKTGRPTIKAFAERTVAEAERRASGGNLLGYEVLKQKELAARCGFCDRSMYPEDGALVKIEGVYSWACCSHCAMGVAARTGKDIEVHQPCRLTGEMIVAKTMGGYLLSVEPSTAVAWYGKRKAADGSYVSAGCFRQGFFTSLENLKKWAEENPTEIGHMITIDQALGDKMKMTPAQIARACKVGECAPR